MSFINPMRLLAVVGPTASGKSQLAASLAADLNAEVVGADAVQCYRQAKIGAAQPSDATRARVVHHLVGFLPSGTPYSAGKYAEQARELIINLCSKGKTVVLCGGSGLYLDALLRGFSPLPSIPAVIRSRVSATLQPLSNQECHALLQSKDPVIARVTNPADRQRIARALEVVLASGTPLSEYQTQPKIPLPATILAFGISWQRAELYQRIAKRTHSMLANGLLKETREILNSGCCPSSPPLNAVGYQQALSCIKGELNHTELPNLIIKRTRQLAKRQLTWLRHHGFGDPEKPALYQDQQLSLSTHWLPPPPFLAPPPQTPKNNHSLPENIISLARKFLKG